MTSTASRSTLFSAALLLLALPYQSEARSAAPGSNERLEVSTPQQPQTESAKKLFEEAEKLRQGGSAEALQNALAKYDRAVLLYRAAGDRKGEVTALNCIASIYNALGDTSKELEEYKRVLLVYQALGDRAGECNTLDVLALTYYWVGEMDNALDSVKQALALARTIGDQSLLAQVLEDTGFIYNKRGEKPTALVFFEEALPISQAIKDRPREASVFNRLGLIYYTWGESQKALDNYDKALSIDRELKNRFAEASTLHNIGQVYLSGGDKPKALEYFNQSLTLSRALGDIGSEGACLHDMASTYEEMGQLQQALDSFNKSLEARRKSGDRRGEAETLGSIGQIYQVLGEKRKGLKFYEQALPIYRKYGYPRGVAATLLSIGYDHVSDGAFPKALDCASEALTAYRAAGDRSGEASALGLTGWIYFNTGEDRLKTVDLVTQELFIFHETKERGSEAATLNDLGYMYNRWGEKEKALEFFNRALALQDELREPETIGSICGSLMTIWKAAKKPGIAIIYGKKAVNAYQEIRANLVGLDRELQRNFLISREDTYRELADLLISEGRLPEAQQVLGFLKEEEYFQYVRRDSDEASLMSAPIAFSVSETELEKRFVEISGRIAVIGVQRSALLAIKDRTPEMEKQLAELENQLEIANQGFQKFLNQLEIELKRSPRSGVDAATLRESQAFKDTLRDLDAIALFTVVGHDKYNVILVTADFEKAYEFPITDADLNSKISKYDELLRDPASSPLPTAQELYRILIGPELGRDIAQTKKQTILWSLDGALRYLPMAALHDGQKYLVETYRNVVITLASRDHLKDQVSPKWQALGLGVAKGSQFKLGNQVFSPLPGVREELRAIVRDENSSRQQKGVLLGKVMLDDQFTVEALKSNLRLRGNEQPYKVVHIASHFHFEPGDETKSFLLLGGDQILTVSQLKNMSQLFSRVELLTLSACETATGGEKDGKEVEGFAVLAQRQGAEAIIASLWKVSDPSTSLLMQRFYRFRDAHPDSSKAEAMRQAQLSLLRGTDAGLQTGGSAARPDLTYTHPHFWAPFILIGNCR
jgi:CHAT domain-containing protein/Tfp pilus assembly protein PilF